MKRKSKGQSSTRPSTPPAKLFIASADAAALHGIARFFAEHCAQVQVCGGCGDAAHALAGCLAAQPASVLVDVEMDGGAGWQLLRDVGKRLPGIACVARLGRVALHSLVEAARVGVRVLCTIADAPESLVLAVQHALAGEAFVSPCAQAILRTADLNAALTAAAAPNVPLGEREKEVYQLLGEGLGTEEIAERMGLARKTVQAHCEHIRQKLGIPSFRNLCQHAALSVGGGPPIR